MQFKDFAEFLEKIESTSGRNDMIMSVAEFLPKLISPEISEAMYLMQGRLVPSYVNLEFNFSNKLALRALDVYIPNKEGATALFNSLGDVGLVAEKLLENSDAKAQKLSLSEVYAQLHRIATATGAGSQEAKMKIFGELILGMEPISARYASRMVIGNLRLGLSDKSVLDALSWMKAGDKSLREIIERAYGVRADIGFIAKLVIDTDLQTLTAELATINLQPGTPLASKLVEREKDSAATFKRMGRCLVQPKLDGLRAQIHFDKNMASAETDGKMSQIYSRNMENLTDVFPDIVAAVGKLGVDSIVIDSEAIGYDKENDTYLPFQETIQRRRKNDIDEAVENIPVRAMAFDLLFLNGEDLSQKPVEERTEKLREILSQSDQDIIHLLETEVLDTEEELEAYFSEQVGKGLEGIIVKKLGTTYDPGTRNFDWIKLKANTRSDLVDTIDGVVIGYYIGQGARAKFGVGTLLLAVYSPEDGKFYSVAKVGSGMKDEDWATIKKDLDALKVDSQPEDVIVNKVLYPDFWVKPKIVTEVIADEITRSPGHTAAANIKANFEVDTKGRGLSLRFPRMKIWNRDKNAEQATTDKELVRLYELRRAPK